MLNVKKTNNKDPPNPQIFSGSLVNPRGNSTTADTKSAEEQLVMLFNGTTAIEQAVSSSGNHSSCKWTTVLSALRSGMGELRTKSKLRFVRASKYFSFFLSLCYKNSLLFL